MRLDMKYWLNITKEKKHTFLHFIWKMKMIKIFREDNSDKLDIVLKDCFRYPHLQFDMCGDVYEFYFGDIKFMFLLVNWNVEKHLHNTN